MRSDAIDAIDGPVPPAPQQATPIVDDQKAGEIVKRPWGELSFYVEDPWGNRLEFVAEAEAGDFIHLPPFVPHREINARVQSLRFRTNQNKPMWKLAMKEHGQMLDAIVARDPSAARTILVEHLLRKRDVVLDLMRTGAT